MSYKHDIRKGDLVCLPGSNRPRGVVGVIVDVDTKANENKVGVSWPDSENDIDYEPIMMLEFIDGYRG